MSNDTTSAPVRTGAPPDIVTALADAVNVFDATLTGVQDGAWDTASPCSDWSTRDVVGHVIGTLGKVALIARGEPTQSAPSQPGEAAAGDPVKAWRDAAAAARTAVAEADPTLQVDTPAGRQNLARALAFPVSDIIVHAWDIAAATGRPLRLPDSLLAHIVHTCAQVPEAALRGPGRIGEARPSAPGADDTTRMMAWLGRDVERWATADDAGAPASRATATDSAELLALDRAHVWHPFRPMPGVDEQLLVTEAEGVRLTLADGRELIDGMSSFWAAVHGYRNPVLDKALADQASRFTHVMFGGLTHEPAIRLARTLVDLTPDGLEHVYFCDSGAVSVEVALKMCLQYWRSSGRSEKRRILTWRRGYHGATLHAMSVCDPDDGGHASWQGLLPEQVFLPAPPASSATSLRNATDPARTDDEQLDPAYVDTMARTIAEHADELAAIIVEPVVQSAGGMRFHDPGYLRVLRELADEHDVLLIFDEMATGFGHTGALFAADHVGVTPDVMCLGKTLTGGYMSMAATLCTTRVADGIRQGELPVLVHGQTFMANALTAAVANASLGLLVDGDWKGDVARIERALRRGLQEAVHVDGVVDVRVLGAIGVIELDHPVDKRMAEAAVDDGVWLRPFGNLIYCLPPYLCTDDDIARICAAMVAAASVGAGPNPPQH
ncbi:adenosylmethionine--8-amino-7-oxononanoate transaminase [Streptomyces sp. TRM68367]|uniref:adenosylmethionine--8-amino-7-oxononanoate transaminase n=1 Tax=Streptomyces sp. TRM68367 TaxID=2758415 RepID=UPI001CA8A7E1|nr:adenosylmethionine--8-amino-7-oxononanoate transaminase [Streptomyces sp. TRM68367]